MEPCVNAATAHTDTVPPPPPGVSFIEEQGKPLNANQRQIRFDFALRAPDLQFDLLDTMHGYNLSRREAGPSFQGAVSAIGRIIDQIESHGMADAVRSFGNGHGLAYARPMCRRHAQQDGFPDAPCANDDCHDRRPN